MQITVTRTRFLFTSAMFSHPWHTCTHYCQKNGIVYYGVHCYFIQMILIFFRVNFEVLRNYNILFKKFIVTTLQSTVWMFSKQNPGWYPSEGGGDENSAFGKTDLGDITARRLTVSTALEVSGSQSSPKERKKTRYIIPPETNSFEDPIPTVNCLQGSSHLEFKYHVKH